MSVTAFIIGFAVAVLVVPARAVRTIQHRVRHAIGALATRSTNDTTNKGDRR